MINKWVNCSVVSDSFDPIDYSLPGSSAHGILQARILEWVAIPFSRGISSTRDRTWVFRIASRFFNKWGQHIPWEQLSLPHLDLLLFSDTDCHHGILLCVFIVSSLKKVFQGCFSLLLNRPLLNEFMVTGLVGEEDVGKRYRVWDQHVHTAIFKTDNHLGPTYSTGNSAQSYVAARMGREFGREWIHVYLWLSPFAVHLKLSQHC